MDKIVIIGAGKIAYSLTAALLKAGYNVDSVLSRSISSAQALAKKFNISSYSDNYSDLSNKAKIFFLCVPDSLILETANCLASCKLKFTKSIFVHLSGSHTANLLNPLKEKGAFTASFHVMQSFPSKKIVNIKNCYCAVETDDAKAEQFLFNLAKKLDLKPFKIGSENKVYYHIAGVFISNFLVGNFYSALKIFKDSQVNNIDFVELMEPILKATISNLRKNGISKALSGPIDRGDADTIIRHLNALAELEMNTETKLNISLNYILQSLNLLEVAKDKYGKASDRQEVIKNIMIEQLKKI